MPTYCWYSTGVDTTARYDFYGTPGGDDFGWDEHKAKGYTFPFNPDEWALVAPSCPQQENGYDCGVFSCTNADFLSVDAPLEYSQGDVKGNRDRICSKILKDSAMP